MIEYIAFRDYKGASITSKIEIIKKGEKFQLIAGRIATLDNPPRSICLLDSHIAHEYFARNDDGNGMLRGAITYAIAFSERMIPSDIGVFRFSEEEQEIIRNEYSRFLRDDSDAILFNSDFFNADIDELAVMARELNINYEIGGM